MDLTPLDLPYCGGSGEGPNLPHLHSSQQQQQNMTCMKEVTSTMKLAGRVQLTRLLPQASDGEYRRSPVDAHGPSVGSVPSSPSASEMACATCTPKLLWLLEFPYIRAICEPHAKTPRSRTGFINPWILKGFVANAR